MVPRITSLSLLLVLSFCFAKSALAYMEDYPPHNFKDGPFPHLEGKPLVALNGPMEYQSADKKIYAKLGEQKFGEITFLLKDGDLVLAAREKDAEELPYPWFVYQADLNGDGLSDFFVISNYRGNGLAAFNDRVEIFLRQQDGSYRKIAYDTMAGGLEDFIDLDKDGKYEIIRTDFYCGETHNYFTYSVYAFADGRLVNADTRFTGFPKFIWYTNKPNDKATMHLTADQKATQVRLQDKAIEYQSIVAPPR